MFDTHTRIMLTEELKEKTAAEHQAGEKQLILVLKRIRSTEDYIRLLSMLYGFYGPLEGLISRQLTEGCFRGTEGSLPDMAKRRRAKYLLADIGESGISTDPCTALPDPCTALPVIESVEEALGSLYVLEGSTLGGRVIAGMICRQLGPGAPIRFFDGYGAETDKMWERYKEFLNRPRDEEQRGIIIGAATATFTAFNFWIGQGV